MTTIKRFAVYLGATFALVLGLALTASPAQAQATRTWVSGVGDDANPCSRTAPCKTFAGAISKTAAGGEINCLDPAGYGAVTITKSITIDCEDTQGSILNAGTTGVIVNGAGVNVTLRGLSIHGGTPVSPGVHGIRFIQGNSLTVEEVFIQNQQAASPNGNGIFFQPGNAAELYVTDTDVVNSGPTAGGSGSGIELAPTAGGSVKAVITRVTVSNHTNNGIRLNTTNGAVIATITDTTVSGNAQGVVVLANAIGGTAFVVDSNISQNSGTGILVSGAGARARVGNTTITGNATGVSTAAGGIAATYGDNRLGANGVDGAFTPPPLPKL